MRKLVFLFLLAAALGLAPACWDDDGAGDADTDAGSDADGDADSDTDTGTEAECDPPAPGFEEIFGNHWSSCGDVEIADWGPSGDCSVGLMFDDFDAPVFQMYYNDLGSLERTYELDEPTSAAIAVAIGFHLSAGFCGAETEILPEVLRTYDATSGTAVLDLTATSDQCTEESCPALADLELIDIIFTADDDPGETVALPYLLAEDVEIDVSALPD